MSKNKLTMPSNSNQTAVILLIALVSVAMMWGRPSLAQDTQSALMSIEASVSLEWDQTAGVYTAIGNAVVEQGDKSLLGDEIIARYDTQSAERDLTEVTATGAVVYRDGDSVARGSRINYVIDAKAYNLSGPGAIVTSPRGTMTAEKTITYTVQDSARKQVIGVGNAAYRGEDGRIVEGERVVAFLDSDSAVEAIEAHGNAKVVTPKGIVAKADRLDYVAATDRANLFGNVEITDHDNILRGARAEVEFSKEISRLLSDNSGKRVTGVLTQ
jgi:lipopolysaccharide export system protein LptA